MITELACQNSLDGGGSLRPDRWPSANERKADYPCDKDRASDRTHGAFFFPRSRDGRYSGEEADSTVPENAKSTEIVLSHYVIFTKVKLYFFIYMGYSV